MVKTENTYLPPAPPMINGLALLLWGWQCEYLIYAMPMAVLLEMARVIPWKIPVTNNEFNHISDLSSIIFLLVAIYSFTTKSYHGIYTILSLLPILLFLLLLAQVYSVQGFIKSSALFISLRRLESSELINPVPGIDLSFPYLFICIISASAGNHHAMVFYISVVFLITWTLWVLRPAYTRSSLWLSLILIATVAGYAGQTGIREMQSIAESTFLGWFDQFMWRSRDPRRTSTAIGSLGKLKLSDRIVLRVDTHHQKLEQPLLLRETTYINYGYGVWTNYQNTFYLIDPVPEGNKWMLNESSKTPEILTIGFHMDDETAVIPVPHGIESITNVNAFQVEHSPYGIVSLELNPGWIKYDVLFNQQQIPDAAPGAEDLDIPNVYKTELQNLVSQLKLDTEDPENAIKILKRFFSENFKYSLTQTARYPRGKYLSKFLFETRKGHCEYFATTTALILRAAGIPTRYVVGYSVSEYSPLERQYIARARHAHSWVLVFVNGSWQSLDTTPSVWAELEEEDTSSLEPIIDLWSWLIYRISRGDVDDPDSGAVSVFTWLLIPLLLFYIWNIFIRKRVKSRATDNATIPFLEKQGLDSVFYKLIKELEIKFFPRKPGQTLTSWIAELENTSMQSGFKQLALYHYKYRFDPKGLTIDEINSMNFEIEKKLAELNVKPS